MILRECPVASKRHHDPTGSGRPSPHEQSVSESQSAAITATGLGGDLEVGHQLPVSGTAAVPPLAAHHRGTGAQPGRDEAGQAVVACRP